MSDETTFFQAENESRSKDFMKNNLHEEILVQLNGCLSSLKRPIKPEYASLPSLFIFGLPRSGTTLLYQLIANCLDVGYIDNIAARFWLSPFHGITLSQVLQKYKTMPNFESNLGQSADIFGPHEFAYFWHHWLRLSTPDDLANFGQPALDIDWAGLQQELTGMKAAFGKPLVFKTMFAANFAEDFEKLLTAPFFIYIERDPSDVALSILEARRKYYATPETWWATYPPNYRDLLNLDVEQQIVGQVMSLRDTYRRKIDALTSDKVAQFSYRELCNAPAQILNEIRGKIAAAYNCDISVSNSAPLSFDFSKKQANDEIGQSIVDALNSEGLK